MSPDGARVFAWLPLLALAWLSGPLGPSETLAPVAQATLGVLAWSGLAHLLSGGKQ